MDHVVVHPSGGDRGVPLFTLGDGTVDLATLQDAASGSRIGLVLDGVQRGEHIRTGIQVMALPIGASVVYPALGSRSVRTDKGMVQDGQPLPYAAYTPTNALWESVGKNFRIFHVRAKTPLYFATLVAPKRYGHPTDGPEILTPQWFRQYGSPILASPISAANTLLERFTQPPLRHSEDPRLLRFLTTRNLSFLDRDSYLSNQ